MYGMNSWCRSDSFYALPDAPSCNECFEPMRSSGLSPPSVVSVSSFRRLIGRGVGGGGGSSICSTLPYGVIFSFPVRDSDHLYAPLSFPPLRRTLLLSDHSAPVYSMFRDVLSSKIPLQVVDAVEKRPIGDGGGGGGDGLMATETTLKTPTIAKEDRTIAKGHQHKKTSTPESNIRHRLKAKRPSDINRRATPPKLHHQNLSSSSSSSPSSSQLSSSSPLSLLSSPSPLSYLPQSHLLEQRMLWLSLPPAPHPSPRIGSRFTDDDDDHSSFERQNNDDDNDNNDDGISSSEEADDETREVDRCTTKQDEMSKTRRGYLVCPVCKRLLKRRQLESHLKEEIEHLVYTRESISCSTPALTKVDSTTNSFSNFQVHTCREESCPCCKNGSVNVSSKLRYDAFLRIRSNRQARLVHQRLYEKQDDAEHDESFKATEPNFQITRKTNNHLDETVDVVSLDS